MIKLLDHPPLCVLYLFFIPISRKYWLIFTFYPHLRGASVPYSVFVRRSSRNRVSRAVSSSYAGNAAHTPFMPNRRLSTSEQTTMAAMPRQMEVMDASAGRSVALR